MNRAVLTAVALLATTLAAAAQQAPSQEVQGDGSGGGAMPAQQENLAASSKPLATVQSDVPGVHTDILSLRRSEGAMLTLRMAFVNDSDAPVKPRSIPGSENPVGGGMVLIDYAGKRKYPIVTFSDGTCLCNSYLGIDDFPPGTRQVWAKFASPPASVRKVSILFPNGELVDDIPIIDRQGAGTPASDRNGGGQSASRGKAAHSRPSKPYL